MKFQPYKRKSYRSSSPLFLSCFSCSCVFLFIVFPWPAFSCTRAARERHLSPPAQRPTQIPRAQNCSWACASGFGHPPKNRGFPFRFPLPTQTAKNHGFRSAPPPEKGTKEKTPSIWRLGHSEAGRTQISRLNEPHSNKAACFALQSSVAKLTGPPSDILRCRQPLLRLLIHISASEFTGASEASHALMLGFCEICGWEAIFPRAN